MELHLPRRIGTARDGRSSEYRISTIRENPTTAPAVRFPTQILLDVATCWFLGQHHSVSLCGATQKRLSSISTSSRLSQGDKSFTIATFFTCSCKLWIGWSTAPM